MPKDFSSVYYPIGGMANITKDLSDIIRYKIKSANQINIVISSQPNSFPHIGTVVNFMCAFSLGQKFSRDFGLPVSVVFDVLENVSGSTITNNEIVYFKSLKNTFEDGISKFERYLPTFVKLLSKLSALTNIPFTTRTYEEYQRNPIVRKTIMTLLRRRDELSPIMNPSDRNLHIRVTCPLCGFGEKASSGLKINDKVDYILLESYCFEHGAYSTILREDNDSFIDINAQLRDLAKGVFLLESDKNDNTLSMMVDGGDWGGLWPLRVHVEPLLLLGYTNIITRFFTPTILDWAGTKLSKRLYVGGTAYQQMVEGLINFESFYSNYGEEGFIKLWIEINSWVDEPKKFFRDYSVDYIQLVLEN